MMLHELRDLVPLHTPLHQLQNKHISYLCSFIVNKYDSESFIRAAASKDNNLKSYY